ncbi:MAG: hypothetical protein IT521_04080 [Burkholderiales bacterium]|nr:hypothetical protein [Burkholderiales bacterium]
MTTIERTVMFSVMSLLTLPLAQEVAQRQVEATQLQVAAISRRECKGRS